MTYSPDKPYLFVQWQGTDVCFDFYCECGEHSHYDGYHASAYRCPHCKREFALPSKLPVIPLAEAPKPGGDPPHAELHADQTSRLCGGFVQHDNAVEGDEVH